MGKNFDLKMAVKHLKIGIFEKFKNKPLIRPLLTLFQASNSF
jgi:hypothetical protein